MGRKKKKQLKPWCWYCNREFDDEKILIQHQKAKHFKCHVCHKKLFTGPGLLIHCMQVHKEKVDSIPNSLPKRNNANLEIYGMEGIPNEDVKEYQREKLGYEEEPETKTIKLDGLSGFQFNSASLLGGNVPILTPSMPSMLPQYTGMQMTMQMARTPIGLAPMNMLMQTARPPIISSPVVSSTMVPFSSATLLPPPTTLTPTTSSAFPANSDPPQARSPSYLGSGADTTAKVPKPTLNADGTEAVLVHPDDDLSLEELRAIRPEYRKYLTRTPSSDLSPQSCRSVTVVPSPHIQAAPLLTARLCNPAQLQFTRPPFLPFQHPGLMMAPPWGNLGLPHLGRF